VAVHVPVGADNRVDPAAPVTLELETSHLVTRAPRVSAVSLQMSIDGGAHWQSLVLRKAGHDQWRVTLPASALPPGSTVSLRTSAVDTAGNAVTQTIHAAFLVAGPPA